MLIDHNTLELTHESQGALCGICDQPVFLGEEFGIAECKHYQHIAHASCIRREWDEKDKS